MAKDLTATVDGLIDDQSQFPVILVELYLNAGTLRFVADKSNLTFGGTVYTAKAIRVSDVEQSAEGQIGRVTVDFDNVTSDMSAYLDDEDFYGKQLIIKRIWRNAVGAAADYNELVNGVCEEVENIDKNWLSVPVTIGEPLHKRALLQIYKRSCNHEFGDAVCNQLGFADLATLSTKDKMMASGSTDYFIGTKAISGTSDFWNCGRVEMWVKGGGVTYHREVLDFYSGTCKVFFVTPLDFSVGNTYTYNIFKGCTRTWDVCNALQPYGPSSSNTKQYGGFLHVSNNKGGQL